MLDNSKQPRNDASADQRVAEQMAEKKDLYELPEFKDTSQKWGELDTQGKIIRVLLTILKVALLLGLLYLFICSLSFLSSAFRLLGGKAAGRAFAENDIMNNPVAGLMIGVLVTVLVQSSSTSTSIVVAMVAAEILKVRTAIPIVMGANIGTTVTNTIVSLGQSIDREQFRRAFAAATVHDMFNLLTVVIFLPIEVMTGMLFELSNTIVSSWELQKDKSLKQDYLKKITKPFTDKVIQIDKGIIEKIAKASTEAEKKKYEDTSLLKEFCDSSLKVVNTTVVNGTTVEITKEVKDVPCDYWFHGTSLGDTEVGIIMLVLSLVLLCTCLVCIVKLLNIMFRGRMAAITRKIVNTDFPRPFGFLTGYLAIIVGAVLTFFVQSSSIFTSALTPLVGCGVVSIYRMYPLTLGSNIGTTTTAILAAFASSNLELTLQIALCHLFFNIFGIIIWYPIPVMRKLPIGMAKALGNTTAQYRWFAVTYIVVVFFLIPGFCFGLSLLGWKVFAGVMIPIALIIIAIVVINILQRKVPRLLPSHLKTWNCVPLAFRSLEPYDRVLVKFKHAVRNSMGRMKSNRRGDFESGNGMDATRASNGVYSEKAAGNQDADFYGDNGKGNEGYVNEEVTNTV